MKNIEAGTFEKRVRLNMVQRNALYLTFIFKILILSPSVSSDAIEDKVISSLNESDSFDFSSILTTSSACEVQKTCKGKILCSSCARIEWHQRAPYILKQTSTQFAALSPMIGILDCKYVFYCANFYLMRSDRGLSSNYSR